MSKRIRGFATGLTLRWLLVIAVAAAPLTISAIVYGFDPISYTIFAVFGTAGALHGAGVLPNRYFR